MNVAGIGRVIFWDGGSLWIGIALRVSDWHEHHAIQVSFGLSGPVQFQEANSSDWVAHPAAVIPSDRRHTFQAPGQQMAHIFTEPESALGRGLRARFGRERIASLEAATARALALPLAAAFNGGASDDALRDVARSRIAELAGSNVPPQRADARVAAAIADIGSRLDEPLAMVEIAERVGLSEGRFRHLFVQETGMAFRAYVLWARLNRALELGYGGASWTEAAHAANFADSAHLTRTCRRMLGISPSAMRLDDPVRDRRMTA